MNRLEYFILVVLLVMLGVLLETIKDIGRNIIRAIEENKDVVNHIEYYGVPKPAHCDTVFYFSDGSIYDTSVDSLFSDSANDNNNTYELVFKARR